MFPQNAACSLSVRRDCFREGKIATPMLIPWNGAGYGRTKVLLGLLQDERFTKIVKGLELEWRGIAGEKTDPGADAVYDISNHARLKNTEVSQHRISPYE